MKKKNAIFVAIGLSILGCLLVVLVIVIPRIESKKFYSNNSTWDNTLVGL